MAPLINALQKLALPMRMANPSPSDPPFREEYQSLFEESRGATRLSPILSAADECELPLIDLSRLSGTGGRERADCKSEIARASREWGFFQAVNHGISREILDDMRREQVKAFDQPFKKKSKEAGHLKFSAGCYRWGTPSATCLRQLSWSEAFHVPVTDISSGSNGGSTLSSIMELFARTVSDLSHRIAEVLAEELGHESTFFLEKCLPSTCYLRMNRYPPCPMPSDLFGLMPHTDSDFLTILHQDEVGGLQLVKDGKWIAVKPNPDALIINIGDLFQVWSNDVYKSVEHRVVSNPWAERFSTAYFLCPSYDTVITSCSRPAVYREFSFGEYRKQVQLDVKNLGYKIGLPRFLL
ncbi:hypothetical protein MLD38_027489 [Melastoma candidum]|uniref:Uncharacterized protein n=1 Tax=Melastoma candidum TaxID=119954 RepID=A0ACB9P3Q4_9MYRT|nr:hypothetical protein MLD38_027489 [Melastoma candidum]